MSYTSSNQRSDNSYEVNIWDIRPDPKYGTGGIVDFAAVPVPPIHKAGGKWNTSEIEAKGADVTVKPNRKLPDGAAGVDVRSTTSRMPAVGGTATVDNQAARVQTRRSPIGHKQSLDRRVQFLRLGVAWLDFRWSTR